MLVSVCVSVYLHVTVLKNVYTTCVKKIVYKKYSKKIVYNSSIIVVYTKK